MKNYLIPVFVATGFLLIYITAIFVNLNTAIILFLFSLSPLILIWMVFKVLKAEVETPFTFDDRWYEDQ
ncbi:hypothetical protein [Pleomorphovibrio marinus]|uniref:hypothetical protein n=1 Tax=Pleomorphovibrio marinus TaxID=2164132 RepID=UPI000E0A7CD7|nr:hypothetical protein [Pleomorphovibrio marinus]